MPFARHLAKEPSKKYIFFAKNIERKIIPTIITCKLWATIGANMVAIFLFLLLQQGIYSHLIIYVNQQHLKMPCYGFGILHYFLIIR